MKTIVHSECRVQYNWIKMKRVKYDYHQIIPCITKNNKIDRLNGIEKASTKIIWRLGRN